MNPAALLALIAELYERINLQQQQILELQTSLEAERLKPAPIIVPDNPFPPEPDAEWVDVVETDEERAYRAELRRLAEDD